ncbi:hypothetical protein FHP05_12110 [Cerasibacillus terrae]|uniref:Uncharacterized protein n=1 Tax=Cerasibacillus terrae TaxID=2498845 RepID=A0A5C8NQ32_9BACI|nr:hypothetical protein [Cerasibacillus terrae]TXL62543.1 hypothetical protein FHP05_12110 [Cerasibacillus terrae]
MDTEKDYKILSEHIYWIDEKHKGYDPDLKKGEVIKEKDFEYKILKIEDNTTNGMQAMAVAPVKNGKVDTSEVVIAFAVANLYSLLSTYYSHNIYT